MIVIMSAGFPELLNPFGVSRHTVGKDVYVLWRIPAGSRFQMITIGLEPQEISKSHRKNCQQETNQEDIKF